MVAERCVHHNCAQPQGRALGLCNAHYIRQSRGKDMDAPVRKSGLSDSERFWTKVNKTDGCWVWTGAMLRGYGLFRLGGTANLAHRISYLWANGEIPKDVQLDHMCHNKSCVNPDHLRFSDHGTNAQNRSSANKNSKSGVRGVYWASDREAWFAAITLNREVIRRGPFDELGEAEKAVIELRREHMPYSLMDQKKKDS